MGVRDFLSPDLPFLPRWTPLVGLRGCRPALRRRRRELHGIDPIGASAGSFEPADRLLTFPSPALPGPSGSFLSELLLSYILRVCAPPPTSPRPSTSRIHCWILRSFASRHRLVFRPRGFSPPRRVSPECGFQHVAAGTGPGVRRVSPRPIVHCRGSVGSRPGFPPTLTPYEGLFLVGSRTASLRPLPSCRSTTARPRSSGLRLAEARSRRWHSAPNLPPSRRWIRSRRSPVCRPREAPKSLAGRPTPGSGTTDESVASPAVASSRRSFLPWVSFPFETCLTPLVSGLSPGSDPASGRPNRDPKILTRRRSASVRRSVHGLAAAGLPGVFDVKERLDLGVGLARKLD